MRIKVAVAVAMATMLGGTAFLVGRGAPDGTAVAAETKPDQAKPAPAKAADGKPGPLWAKACAKDEKAGELCFVEQYAIAEPQKVVLLNVRFGYLGPDGAPRMILATPLGVTLPPGLTLALDQEKPLTMPFGTCQQNGCVAIADLDADALKRFASGKTLGIRYLAGDGKPIDIPVQLTGLSDALKTLPAPKAAAKPAAKKN